MREKEPCVEEIKTRIGLVKELAKLRTDSADDGATGFVTALVKEWGDLAAGGLTLISGNCKIRDGVMAETGDVSALLSAMPDAFSLLRTVVGQRKRVLKAIERINSIKESLGKCAVGDELPPQLSHYMSLDIPSTLADELNLQEFDDVVGFQAAEFESKLQEKWTAFKEAVDAKLKKKEGALTMNPFIDLASQGKFNWKRELADDATLPAIQDAAKATLFALLPGPAMKEFGDALEQDRHYIIILYYTIQYH